MDDVAYLPVSGTLAVDEDGNPSVLPERWRKVFVTVGSVAYEEAQRAAQDDLKAAWKLKVFHLDYGQEASVEFRGRVYRIYRAYLNAAEETYELYLAERTGPSGVAV